MKMRWLLLTIGTWAARLASFPLWPFAWLHQSLSNVHVDLWNRRVDMKVLSFDEWWKVVTETAKEQGAEDLLGDQESHLAGFEGGYTPAEEVNETVYSAAVSM